MATKLCKACQTEPVSINGVCGECWAASGGTAGIFAKPTQRKAARKARQD